MKKYFLFLFIIILASCSSTSLVSSWKSPEAVSTKYNKVLVIGMMGSKDNNFRATTEGAMVEQLNNSGITAVSAYTQYGPKAFGKLTEEQAVKMVSENGYDGVMIIALLDKNRERYYSPGYVYSTPYAIVGNRWWPNYTVLYDRVYSPGYYSSSTNYMLEANLYATKGDKLQYSAQAKSSDPSSTGTLANEFSKTVVNDMTRKGIMAK